MSIIGNTVVRNQPVLIGSYLSEVTIADVSIYNITSDDTILSIVESSINITNSNIYDLHTSNLGVFVALSFETIALFGNITYQNSSAKFIEALSSDIVMIDVNISALVLNEHLIG